MVQKASYKTVNPRNNPRNNGHNGKNGNNGVIDIDGHSTDYLFERARKDPEFQREILGRIFEQHYESSIKSRLLRIKKRYLSSMDQDDFLDEMLIRLVEKWLPSFDPKKLSFNEYISVCAQNASIDLYRKLSKLNRVFSLEDIDEELIPHHAEKDPLEIILDKELMEKIDLSLLDVRKKNPSYCQALELVLQGYDGIQSASIQNCSPALFRLRKMMAKRLFKKRLKANYPAYLQN